MFFDKLAAQVWVHQAQHNHLPDSLGYNLYPSLKVLLGLPARLTGSKGGPPGDGGRSFNPGRNGACLPDLPEFRRIAMGLSKELLRKAIEKEFVSKLLDNSARRIVNKGAEVSDVDLYNLCLINRERDEINSLAEEVEAKLIDKPEWGTT